MTRYCMMSLLLSTLAVQADEITTTAGKASGEMASGTRSPSPP